MIDFLVIQVKLGNVKIDDIPNKYKQQVKDKLNKE